jgi:uncharacterized protein
MKRFFRYVLGIFFLILGVIGLFLPILQGILFIFIGLLILAPESRLIRKFLARLRRKYPVLFEKAEQIKKKFIHHEPKTEPDETDSPDCAPDGAKKKEDPHARPV